MKWINENLDTVIMIITTIIVFLQGIVVIVKNVQNSKLLKLAKDKAKEVKDKSSDLSVKALALQTITINLTETINELKKETQKTFKNIEDLVKKYEFETSKVGGELIDYVKKEVGALSEKVDGFINEKEGVEDV